jgi:hypothetical protein
MQREETMSDKEPKPSIPEGPAGSVIAGRDMKGVAAATGAHSMASAHYRETALRDPKVDLAAELAALRQVLSGLNGLDSKALTRLDEAQQEANKPDPDRGEVQNLITQATRYAKSANGFAEQAEKLAPPLMRIAAWLGQAWSSWGPALGL